MDTDQDLRRGVPMGSWETRPEPADIRFRPGQGGEMSPEWAAYMLNLWWSARDKKLTFAEAAKAAAVHFMVGEQ